MVNTTHIFRVKFIFFNVMLVVEVSEGPQLCRVCLMRDAMFWLILPWLAKLHHSSHTMSFMETEDIV